MYLRETRRRNKDGTTVCYLALAQNERDAKTGVSRARIIHSFGRADQVDREALKRLVASISRFLDPVDQVAATVSGEVRLLDSRPMGSCWLADRLWERLGVGEAIITSARDRRLDGPGVERAIFAMVANRLSLKPSSKLAGCEWVAQRAFIDRLAAVSDDACYRATDFLLDALAEIQQRVFFNVANLLDLEVDLLFFDTSSTYWETDRLGEDPDDEESQDGEPAPSAACDEPAATGEVTSDTSTAAMAVSDARDGDGRSGKEQSAEENTDDHTGGQADDAEKGSLPVEEARRSFSKHSKDHRPDLPQVVLAMAVTRTGIPVRLWVFPGSEPDQKIIRKAKQDLKAWNLSRVIWVADRGFTSERNRRYLQRGGGHYIIGEKLRSGSKEAQQALQRPGRYHTIEGNLQVKEVRIDDGTMRDRFVICHNPERAERDRIIREQLTHQLEAQINDSDKLSASKRSELYGQLQTKPAYNRLLRKTSSGKLRIDRSAIAREQKLDGKFLLRTSDATLTASDIAQGYKALYEVERGWRDLKSTLQLRPVYHHRPDRIQAHMQICWLALLVMRVAETQTGKTWRELRNELDRMHLVTLQTDHGQVSQRTEITQGQRRILTTLKLPEPPLFHHFTPATTGQ